MACSASLKWFLPLALVLSASAAFSQGVPVGPEFRLNTYTTNEQRVPAVTVDLSGNFVAVWASTDQDGSEEGIFGQRYADSGAPLGSEFRVNTTTFNREGHPAVASDSAGNFVVVWASNAQDGSSWGVFGQRFAASGAPVGPEFRVNTFTLNGQYYPRVAMDGAGNFVVVWEGDLQDGSGYGVLGQRYAASGAPLGPEFAVNSFTPGDQENAAIASDSAGNFVVVWQSGTQDGSSWGIFGQRYASSGTPQGPEFRVNTYTTNNQYYPAVASSSTGDFIVVWTGFMQDSEHDFFGQRFGSSGAPLGAEFRANTETISNQWFGSVGSDPAGNFVIVWSGDTPRTSSYDVLGQRYDSSGVPQGPEFRVNTYSTFFQNSPVVAAGAGSFLVVWTSYSQEGIPGAGVFGQRFSPVVPVELMAAGVE